MDVTELHDEENLLLRAGMAAPTAVNKQPWHFIAVTSKDKLKEMAINNPNARMLEQAPLTIVVCGTLCAIIIGHPAENPEPKDKWLPENVSYNEFGGQAE